MEHIHETNEKFPFQSITVSKPIAISAGVFFMKFSMNGMPVYIHPPKCSMKGQGQPVPSAPLATKPKKISHSDFIFSQENDDFLRWTETLEEFAQNKIYENREKCFETELEMTDIESLFTTPLKMYKSGKCYLLRANFPKTESNTSPFKIYDENENEVSMDQITEKMEMMVILEIQGIRCSTTQFQIEFEVKQMMVMNQINLFEKCLFGTRNKNSNPILSDGFSKNETLSNTMIESPSQPVIESSIIDAPSSEDDPVIEPEPEPEPLSESFQKKEEDLCEIDFDLDKLSSEDTITLKQRKEVYYEMYIEARRKAKIARDLALTAFLEAKRIKNTYMLDDIIDSDDDSDYETDEEDILNP
jgi:hypothetical protein